MRALIVVGVSIAVAGSAAAESGIRVGAELGASYLARDDKASDLTWVAPAIAIRAGYGASDGLAVGVRFGITRLGFVMPIGTGSADRRPAERYGEVPIDIALAAQYVTGRQWAVLWLGLRFSHVTAEEGDQLLSEDNRFVMLRDLPSEWTTTSLVTGLTGGYDLWVHGANRVGAYAELAVGAREHGDADRYFTVSAGVAYRR